MAITTFQRDTDDDTDVSTKKGLFKFIGSILFGYFGLGLIVALYCIGGAYAFITIELPNENKVAQVAFQKEKDNIDTINYMVNFLWYQNTQNLTRAEYQNLVRDNLLSLQSWVVRQASNLRMQFKGTLYHDYVHDWTFSKSLLYTVQTVTTIGYGSITPVTSLGQMFMIVYSLIGIPLTLVFLANIGEAMAKGFIYSYSRVCCRWCRMRRYITGLKKGRTPEARILWKEDYGVEKYMPTDQVNVPITILITMIALFLFLGGLLFSSWEGWPLYSACYFTFVTLATIGFGDYVPGNSFSTAGSLESKMKMLFCCCFMFFGMALISMCISLMQQQLVDKAKWIAQELGLSDEDVDPVVKYKIKKSKEGTVMETPDDRFPNKNSYNGDNEEERDEQKKDLNAVLIQDYD